PRYPPSLRDALTILVPRPAGPPPGVGVRGPRGLDRPGWRSPPRLPDLRPGRRHARGGGRLHGRVGRRTLLPQGRADRAADPAVADRKSTRLNFSHVK